MGLMSKHQTNDEKAWLEREQREAVTDLDALAEKVVDALVSTFDQWKRLCAAEMAWKETWKQRGCPGGRPFRSRARQTFADFLGIDRHVPSKSANGYLKRISCVLEEDQYAR